MNSASLLGFPAWVIQTWLYQNFSYPHLLCVLVPREDLEWPSEPSRFSFLLTGPQAIEWVSLQCSLALCDLPPEWPRGICVTQSGPSKMALFEVWNLEIDKGNGPECLEVRQLKGSYLKQRSANYCCGPPRATFFFWPSLRLDYSVSFQIR